MKNKSSCKSLLSRHTEQPLRHHSQCPTCCHSKLDLESRRLLNRETLKPCGPLIQGDGEKRNNEILKTLRAGDLASSTYVVTKQNDNFARQEPTFKKTNFTYPRNLLSGICRWDEQQTPDRNARGIADRGFTLIELLVVVLIIGILASIALPQYQKSVAKARLAQVDTLLDAGKKNVELYLLENGYPSSGIVYLTGANSESSYDMPGDCTGSEECLTDSWIVRATVDAAGFAGVRVQWRGSSGVFPENMTLPIGKANGSRIWFVDDVRPEPNQVVCQWLKGRGYPVITNTFSKCQELGVTLEQYTE